MQFPKDLATFCCYNTSWLKHSATGCRAQQQNCQPFEQLLQTYFLVAAKEKAQQ